MDGRGFLEELKRRHVWRVAVAYAIAAWLLVQIATQVFPFFSIPSWVVRVVVILLALGFPAAVTLAWAFEMTPEGVRRTAPADSYEARPEHEHHRIGRKLNGIIVTALVFAVALLGWRLYSVQRMAPRATGGSPAIAPTSGRHATSATVPAVATPAKSIAVLPFENLSGDKENDYFAAGMQDLILTKLADIGDLKVIARTSTAKYASHPEDLKTVGRQLGVASILEGSVQKQGRQVLINVQLIDVASDSHLWAQDYTRTLDNVFGVEGEVAEKIAAALDAKLSSAETANLVAVPTRNEAAYDLFLRAEYKTNQAELGGGNPLLLAAAIPLYRQAIEKDPSFALAYARLSYAESYFTYEGAGGQDAAQLNERARGDAEKALKLAPDLAAAQLALGYNAYWGRRDFEGGLKAFSAALARRPNDPDALEGQGLVLRRMGHFDAALASLEQAFTQNPRNSVLTEDIAETYMVMERYPDAQRWLVRSLTLAPDNIVAREQYVRSILFGSGDISRALAAATGDSNRMKVGTRVPLLIYQRRYRDALDLLDSVPVKMPDPYLAYVVVGKPQTKARLLRLLGEPGRTRPLYAQVLPKLRAQLAVQRDINLAYVWSNVAEAELGLGQTAEGLDALAKSQAIASRSDDRITASRLMQFNAALYVQAARPDVAVPLLARALATPGIGGNYSPVMLWLDPYWDPIRKDAQFQALLKQYARYKPASIPLAATPMAH